MHPKLLDTRLLIVRAHRDVKMYIWFDAFTQQYCVEASKIRKGVLVRSRDFRFELAKRGKDPLSDQNIYRVFTAAKEAWDRAEVCFSQSSADLILDDTD